MQAFESEARGRADTLIKAREEFTALAGEVASRAEWTYDADERELEGGSIGRQPGLKRR